MKERYERAISKLQARLNENEAYWARFAFETCYDELTLEVDTLKDKIELLEGTNLNTFKHWQMALTRLNMAKDALEIYKAYETHVSGGTAATEALKQIEESFR